METERSVARMLDIHSALLTQLQLPKHQRTQLLTNALRRVHQLCITYLRNQARAEDFTANACIWLEKYLKYCQQFGFQGTLFFEFASTVRALRGQLQGGVCTFYIDLLTASEDAALLARLIHQVVPTIQRAGNAPVSGPDFGLNMRPYYDLSGAVSIEDDYALFQQEVRYFRSEKEHLMYQMREQETQAATQYKELQEANFYLVEQLREANGYLNAGLIREEVLQSKLAARERDFAAIQAYYEERLGKLSDLLADIRAEAPKTASLVGYAAEPDGY